MSTLLCLPVPKAVTGLDRLSAMDETFGELLRAARKRRKMTQREVAEAVNLHGGDISQSYISLIERTAGTADEPQVSYSNVTDLAKVLDMDRKRALLAAGHNPDSPRERLARDQGSEYAVRIQVEFDLIGPDGKRQTLRPDDLSPALRRKLAAMLLSGELDDPAE